jgi:hypothetical protein
MAIWRMRFACWVPKDTNTLSEYAIRIAFPRQQRLRERASVLHCMYNASVAITETVCVYCSVQPHSLNITGLMQKNVSWLKRAMVGMSPRRSGLDPRPVRVRLVVVKVTPGQLFLHILRCFPLIVHTHLNLITTVRRTSRRNLGTFKQNCAVSDIGERWTENNPFYVLKYVHPSSKDQDTRLLV